MSGTIKALQRLTQRAADWRVRKPRKDRFSTRQPLTRTVGRQRRITMIPYEEMPNDNAKLVDLIIDFPVLQPNTAESCPIVLADIVDYLRAESPDGEMIQAAQLYFLRTAQVVEKRYWIWSFQESDGSACYVTATVASDGSASIGYEENHYGLSPEQFILGDYHRVF